jgi:hypothetical protein
VDTPVVARVDGGDADDELLQPDLPVAASSRRPRSHATLTNRQPR